MYSNSQYTYKATYELLDEVSKRPDIHIVLEEFSFALFVIICVYACQYKATVHEQQQGQHCLKKNPYNLCRAQQKPLLALLRHNVKAASE